MLPAEVRGMFDFENVSRTGSFDEKLRYECWMREYTSWSYEVERLKSEICVNDLRMIYPNSGLRFHFRGMNLANQLDNAVDEVKTAKRKADEAMNNIIRREVERKTMAKYPDYAVKKANDLLQEKLEKERKRIDVLEGRLIGPEGKLYVVPTEDSDIYK